LSCPTLTVDATAVAAYTRFSSIRESSKIPGPQIHRVTQVQDPAKWEAGFRTRGELFRK